MKFAIKEQELNAIIAKCRRGEFILWDELVKAAIPKLYDFYGVGKIYRFPIPKLTDATRYVHTKGKLAALFGVTRTTFARWEAAGLITVKRIKPPQQMRLRYSWIYDAKDVLKQLNSLQRQQQRNRQPPKM